MSSQVKSSQVIYSVSVRVQKEDVYILTSRPIILDVYSLLAAVTPTILDVLDLFYGRKSARLGVNGNPAHTHIHTYIYTYIHTHTHTHTYTDTYIHTYIHTCTHTCTVHTYNGPTIIMSITL